MRKKNKIRQKLPSIKKLQDHAEHLWKFVCHLRDGEGCQVEKLFPSLSVQHSSVYQIDHCFSRQNKHLFVEVSNGTKVCSSCNMNKKFQNKSVHRAIDHIVIRREGLERFEEMRAIDMSMAPNLNWGKRDWLEAKIDELNKAVEALTAKNKQLVNPWA